MKKNLNSLFLEGKIKKILGILLLLMFCLVPLLADPCGDVNSSGEIDIVDALLIAQFYVDLNPQNFDEGAADADGNGTIDIIDALLIAQYYVELISELPGCVVPATPTPGSSQTYELQAETKATWDDAEFENIHSGYTGSGYVNTVNASNTWIEWSFDLLDPGNAICEFRYASESGDRSMDLSINGSVVTHLIFPASGGWTTWATEEATVSLNAGINTIRLTATTSNGAPNMDKLDITTGSAVPSPDPTPIATPTPTPGPSAPPNSGIITINDPVTGWATMGNGTSGGGTNLNNAVTVSSMSALRSAAGGSGQKIVLVEPGSYSGTLSPGANTTIIGKAPGVRINGNISISGSGSNNIIIRNISVRGNKCGSYDDCKSGSDAVYIGNDAHHIWFDHCDISDGQDGNFDVTRGGDFITASWTKFYYSYDKEHKFSNLIAGGDGETSSRNKLNITYMFCWWGERVEQRQPRGRFGKIHVFNCLYTSQNTTSGCYLLGPGFEMAMIAENNYFDVPETTPLIHEFGDSKGWLVTGSYSTNKDMNSASGSVFDIPYDYSLISASQVYDLVSASVGGAGNTCTFMQ